MKNLPLRFLLGFSLGPLIAAAQAVVPDDPAAIEGSIGAEGGGARVRGDLGRFEQNLQQTDGFGGIDTLHYRRATSAVATFTFDGHAEFGNDDFGLRARWANPDAWYVEVGYQSFRVVSDATGGYFAPTASFLPVDGTALHLDRSHFWFETGLTPDGGVQWKLRYDLTLRQGGKDSTEWGDLTLPVYGVRNIVPAQLNLNEHVQTVSADAAKTTEEQAWLVHVSEQHTSLNDAIDAARQPGTALAREVTTASPSTSDLFATSAHYERKLGEKASVTTGGMISLMDTNLGNGSRIYGASVNAPFSLVSVNRQSHDEGFYGLTGGGELKDYVGNLNFEYRPTKFWQVTTALRLEDQQTSDANDWVDTNVAATGGATSLTHSSAVSNEHWLYTDEQVQALYTGWRNWTWTARADWGQGTGNLVQDSIDLDTASSTAFNNTDYTRTTAKYSGMANWYARRGLTFSAQGYYRLLIDNAHARIDSTPADYPNFTTDESIGTVDYNLRMTWRPLVLLSFITRYDYQRSDIRDTMSGLTAVDSSRFTSHIVSETVTANPLARLYVTVGVNVAFNQLGTPATDTTVLKNGDSNYTDGSLTAGYALDARSDLNLDYAIYTAFNLVNDPATTLPYGAEEHQNTASLTWVRRQTKHLVYTVKLTYATYRDGATGGLDNYTAEILYAKVQYRF
jgi:hypothetical protein